MEADESCLRVKECKATVQYGCNFRQVWRRWSTENVSFLQKKKKKSETDKNVHKSNDQVVMSSEDVRCYVFHGPTIA